MQVAAELGNAYKNRRQMPPVFIGIGLGVLLAHSAVYSDSAALKRVWQAGR